MPAEGVKVGLPENPTLADHRAITHHRAFVGHGLPWNLLRISKSRHPHV